MGKRPPTTRFIIGTWRTEYYVSRNKMLRTNLHDAKIQPKETAKLLEVIFGQELRWKQHVQQAVKRANKVAIAICGLRHLRPAQMRQLYQACIMAHKHGRAIERRPKPFVTRGP